MLPEAKILVCFALPEEARPFERRARGYGAVRILLTGMGGRNAEHSLRHALGESLPSQVLSCGFAGGLDPGLGHGTVLFEADDETAQTPGLLQRLETAGASRGQFHGADRVVITALEKLHLWLATGAAAVEMESGAIRNVCRAAGVPCLTVRVVSDVAHEDLPVDFNALMGENQILQVDRLLRMVIRSPRLVWPLIRLQRRSRLAAEKLAEALAACLDLAGEGGTSATAGTGGGRW